MKATLLALATLIATTMGIIAEEVEFRLITLQGENLSDDRIKELLPDSGLGLEHRYLVPVEAGKLSFDDTREVQYPTEYSNKGVVVKKESKKLGTTISGKVVRNGGYRYLAFNFRYSSKVGDNVVKVQDGLAVVSPMFNTVANSGKWVIKDGDNAWYLIPLPNQGKEPVRYICLLYTSPSPRDRG